MELVDPFAEWIPLTAQVPRKDQLVRVMTIGGIEHRAVFTVAYTTDWPEGASWMPTKDEEVLSFWDVWIWSQNPEASAPTLEEAWTPEPVESVPAPALNEEDRVYHPALATALLDEISRGKVLLAGLDDGGLGWSPQPSIPSVGTLACRALRVLERIQWIVEIDETERTLEPSPVELSTAKEIQDAYANGAKPVRAALENLTDDALEEPWKLTYTGRPRVEITRAEALLIYGLRPLVSVTAELSVLIRALGHTIEHPTPEWPFGDEPEALIVPEFDEEALDEPGLDAEEDVCPADDGGQALNLPDGRVDSHTFRSYDERTRIRAERV